ncbi:MAG: agmatinase [Deltaproteobacteria bacterium]|nr:agmatinase [Deltaproteobacteria bacterium]
MTNPDPAPARVALLGFRYDAQSSFLRWAADAPPVIRAALQSDSSNLWTELGLDLAEPGLWSDHGDIAVPESDAWQAVIEAAIAGVLARGAKPLSLGGDHSITLPIVRAVAPRAQPLTILHFDAHPDLYDHYEGNRFSHACPFARIMEAGLATRLVQVGVRSLHAHQREQAARFGVELIEMRHWARTAALRFDTPVYVSFDVDGLDPAFAPGVSHPEGGGFTTRQALDVLHALAGNPRAPIVGADLVELNPHRDVGGITAATCAKLVKELIGLMSAIE